MVDIVSKNGCLLLNVGPRADGTIPDEDKSILLAIGKWLNVNGEAIYGSTYWKIHGEGPTTTATGHLAESKDKPFTAEDIRFTQKDGNLFAIMLDWPADSSLIIKTLGSSCEYAPKNIQSIELLGSAERIEWKQTPEGLSIELPNTKPCEFAYTLKIQLEKVR